MHKCYAMFLNDLFKDMNSSYLLFKELSTILANLNDHENCYPK